MCESGLSSFVYCLACSSLTTCLNTSQLTNCLHTTQDNNGAHLHHMIRPSFPISAHLMQRQKAAKGRQAPAADDPHEPEVPQHAFSIPCPLTACLTQSLRNRHRQTLMLLKLCPLFKLHLHQRPLLPTPDKGSNAVEVSSRLCRYMLTLSAVCSSTCCCAVINCMQASFPPLHHHTCLQGSADICHSCTLFLCKCTCFCRAGMAYMSQHMATSVT